MTAFLSNFPFAAYERHWYSPVDHEPEPPPPGYSMFFLRWPTTQPLPQLKFHHTARNRNTQKTPQIKSLSTTITIREVTKSDSKWWYAQSDYKLYWDDHRFEYMGGESGSTGRFYLPWLHTGVSLNLVLPCLAAGGKQQMHRTKTKEYTEQCLRDAICDKAWNAVAALPGVPRHIVFHRPSVVSYVYRWLDTNTSTLVLGFLGWDYIAKDAQVCPLPLLSVHDIELL